MSTAQIGGELQNPYVESIKKGFDNLFSHLYSGDNNTLWVVKMKSGNIHETPSTGLGT